MEPKRAIDSSTIDSSFGLHDSFHDSPSPCARAPASASPVRGTCGERAAVEYLRLKYTTGGASELIHTTGKKKLTHATRARGERVSPRVMARLGSATASMKALDHANTRLLIPCQHKVAHTLPLRRVCGKKKAVVYVSSKTPPVLYRHTCAERRCARAYCITSSFGLHDSPSPCTRAPASTFPHGVRAANERRCIHG